MAPQRIQDSKADSSASADRGGIVKARRGLGASMIREGSGLKDVVAANNPMEGTSINGNGNGTGTALSTESIGVSLHQTIMESEANHLVQPPDQLDFHRHPHPPRLPSCICPQHSIRLHVRTQPVCSYHDGTGQALAHHGSPERSEKDWQRRAGLGCQERLQCCCCGGAGCCDGLLV